MSFKNLSKEKHHFNILIIFNDGYMNLAKIFLNSLYKNASLKNINRIIVGNIGLSKANQDFLISRYPKIEVYHTHENITSHQIQSPEWIAAVSQKTKILLELVKKMNETIIMMDIDMIIMDDFSHVINKNYDLQVCKREEPAFRNAIFNTPGKFQLDYIGSFLITNSSASIPFLEEWIDKIDYLTKKKIKSPFETPALCLVVKEFKSKLKIDELDERVVSCKNNYYPGISSVVHMKSTGKSIIRDTNEKLPELELRQLKARIRFVDNLEHDYIFKLINEYPQF